MEAGRRDLPTRVVRYDFTTVFCFCPLRGDWYCQLPGMMREASVSSLGFMYYFGYYKKGGSLYFVEPAVRRGRH